MLGQIIFSQFLSSSPWAYRPMMILEAGLSIAFYSNFINQELFYLLTSVFINY